MAVLVIFTIASRGFTISGSGTSSTRRSSVPYQQLAFIDFSRVMNRRGPRRIGRAPVSDKYLFAVDEAGLFPIGNTGSRLAAETGRGPYIQSGHTEHGGGCRRHALRLRIAGLHRAREQREIHRVARYTRPQPHAWLAS